MVFSYPCFIVVWIFVEVKNCLICYFYNFRIVCVSWPLYPPCNFFTDLISNYAKYRLFNLMILHGSGGRDLSGNKRTNKAQSFDQKFESYNEALRVSCNKGYPVRVVR